MNIAHYFRCCLNCGSLFPMRDNFLCRDCWGQVQRDHSQSVFCRRVNFKKIEGYSLWDWHPEKNDALSTMLVALKAWRGVDEWNLLAQMLVQHRFSAKAKWQKPQMIVPAPSHRRDEDNHAIYLAGAIGQQLQIPVQLMLAKGPQESQSQHQRKLKKMQRQSLRICRREKFSQSNLLENRVLLIDDVLTTGGTAAASLEALSPLQHYEIWCLAHRALL